MDDRPIILNRDPKEKQIYIGNANYKFDNKKYTTGGILSLILFVLAAAVLGLEIWVSYRACGEGGILLGAVGFMVLLVSLSGFIIGIMSFQEEDRHYLFSRLGTLLNFALILIWGCVYLIGI